MELSGAEASRLLFGLTAAYHFLFVPFTIGLMALIALLEGLALWKGRAVYRDVARFLSWPFLINFACGLLTGYPLRSQISHNWAGYAEVVAPLFASVFSFEGRLAPVMLALVALFALGWRMKPVWHWLVSTALALVLIVQSSAILMLNAWMQNPVGADFSGAHVRVSDITPLLSNPLLLPKVLHTVGGAWVLGGVFLVAISALYLLRKRHHEWAAAGLQVGSRFTLFSLVLAGVAGHWSGEKLVAHQPMKFAAIEAIWQSDAHAGNLVLFAWPDRATQTNRYELALPGGLSWVLSSAPQVYPSLKQQAEETARMIRRDLKVPGAAHAGPQLGPLGLLDTAKPKADLTEADIERAAQRALPNVPLVFWSFRVMLLCWALLLGLMLALSFRAPATTLQPGRLILMACVAALPLPWVAIEAGWVVCEAGRQPWLIQGMLATQASLGAVTAPQALEHLLMSIPVGVLVLLINVGSLVIHFWRGPRLSRNQLAPTEPALAQELGLEGAQAALEWPELDQVHGGARYSDEYARPLTA